MQRPQCMLYTPKTHSNNTIICNVLFTKYGRCLTTPGFDYYGWSNNYVALETKQIGTLCRQLP